MSSRQGACVCKLVCCGCRLAPISVPSRRENRDGRAPALLLLLSAWLWCEVADRILISMCGSVPLDSPSRVLDGQAHADWSHQRRVPTLLSLARSVSSHLCIWFWCVHGVDAALELHHSLLCRTDIGSALRDVLRLLFGPLFSNATTSIMCTCTVATPSTRSRPGWSVLFRSCT